MERRSLLLFELQYLCVIAIYQSGCKVEKAKLSCKRFHAILCYTKEHFYCGGENMLVLRLDDEVEKRVSDLAYRQGRNKSALVREALIRYMEDQEDIEMAEAVLNNMKGQKTLTIEEANRALGLDD